MSGFRSILHRSPYQAGVVRGSGAEVLPVVPLRPDEVEGEVETPFLVRFGEEGESSEEGVTSTEGQAGESGQSNPEEDLEALQKEAEERGRRESREELAEAMRGYEESKASLLAMVKGVDEMREGWAQQQREALGTLVLQTLERLVSEVPALLDEHLRKGCDLAVEQMISAQHVDVHVHPDDFGLAEEILGEREGWALMTDDSIRGGCRVEAPSGRLDASLSAALEAVSGAIESWKQESAPQEESGN